MRWQTHMTGPAGPMALPYGPSGSSEEGHRDDFDQRPEYVEHIGVPDASVTAQQLGLSTADLKGQLTNGKSLDDVATEQGVSHDELIDTIKAGLPTTSTGSVDSTATAEKIASGKGTPPPPPPGGGPKGANTGVEDTDKLEQLSSLLKMDSGDVKTRATSATDLIKMMQDKGIDLGQLRNVLNSGDLMDVSA
jgi:hypothetical protein